MDAVGGWIIQVIERCLLVCIWYWDGAENGINDRARPGLCNRLPRVMSITHIPTTKRKGPLKIRHIYTYTHNTIIHIYTYPYSPASVPKKTF